MLEVSSSKAAQRMPAIENRQDHLDEKLSKVLAYTKPIRKRWRN
jgi:hypothetical protein